MKISILWSMILPPLLLLAGCSIFPERNLAPAQYDFGPPPTQSESSWQPCAAVQLQEITAPDWLSGTAIHYRLIYSDPNQLRNYADSRWTAPPAEMLRARLSLALDNAAIDGKALGAPMDCVLYVELQEFEQDFSAPNTAAVSMQVHVTLRSPRNGAIVAERGFAATVASAPNARGAAAALTNATDKIIGSVLDWLKLLQQK